MQRFFLLLSISLGLFSLQPAAAKPILIQYSTFLTDANKQPRTLTNATVVFRLYRTQTGALPFWGESHAVNVKNGYLLVTLGSKESLRSDSIDSADELWLEMQVNTETYGRQRISTSFYAVSAIRADTARLASVSDTANVSKNAQLLNGLSAAAFSDTNHTHASVAFSDSSAKAALAELAHRVTEVDSNAILGGAVTASKLASGAITADNLPVSKNGDFEVRGILSADSIRFRTAKKRKINIAGNCALPLARRLAGRNMAGEWYATNYTQIASPSSATDTFAVFLPFQPPSNSVLKKITARFSDNSTILPNVAVSIYGRNVMTGAEINYYATGSQASTSSGVQSNLVVTTAISMNPDYVYLVMGIYEGVNNATTAFQDAQLEFDVVDP